MRGCRYAECQGAGRSGDLRLLTLAVGPQAYIGNSVRLRLFHSIRLLLCLLCMLLLNVACANKPSWQGIEQANVNTGLNAEIHTHPDGKGMQRSLSFSILPLAHVYGAKARMQRIDQQLGLAFMLRNSLEGRGYRYEASWDNADLLVLVDAYQLQNKHITNMPVYDLPELHPGANLHELLGDQLDEKIYAAYRVYPWGGYPAFDNQSNLSGPAISVQAKTKSEELHDHAQLNVWVVQRKTMELVWAAAITANSEATNLVISAQQLLRAMMSHVPIAQKQKSNQVSATGMLGLAFAIATVDGKSFYPLVTRALSEGTAAIAGVEPYDVLLEINGSATQNQAYSVIAGSMQGPVGTAVRLTTWRVGEIKPVDIQRYQRLR